MTVAGDEREPVWVAREVVLVLHERLLAEHGGAPGLRDDGLLESALARPRQLRAYGDPDLCALAAAYAAGLVRNHPFVDGNKRIAFMTAYVFLARNGRRLLAPEAEATAMMRGLAAGEIDEAAFAAWLRASSAGKRATRPPPARCSARPGSRRRAARWL